MLAITGIVTASNMETSLSVDGRKRFSTKFQYRSNSFNAGIAGRYSPCEPFEYMGGVNLPLVSIGHLGDTGLASEIRNPRRSAVARITERTRFTSDIRSLSRSRLGISLMNRAGRFGVTYEKRENVEAGIIWATPLYTENWTADLIVSYGLLEKEAGEDSWYQEEIETAGGPFTVNAVRLRYHPKGWTVGITGLCSAGVSLCPGSLVAFSWYRSGKAWRLRGRMVTSSFYCRDADGERLNEPFGASFDVRYRPITGLQVSLDYQGALETGIFKPDTFTSEISSGLGWRGKSWYVGIRDSFILDPGSDRYFDENRFTAETEWNFAITRLETSGSYAHSGEWRVQCQVAFEPGENFEISILGKLHRETGPLLFDCRLKTRLNIGTNRVLISLSMADIPEGWKNHELSSHSLDTEIRWIREF